VDSICTQILILIYFKTLKNPVYDMGKGITAMGFLSIAAFAGFGVPIAYTSVLVILNYVSLEITLKFWVPKLFPIKYCLNLY